MESNEFTEWLNTAKDTGIRSTKDIASKYGITIGSMFAGIGGICLGFKQNGCELVWANEIDKHACKTYRLNFGDSYLVEGDIQQIDTKSIPS